MNVTIQKLNGLWHLIVGCVRSGLRSLRHRTALVVAYARGVYPAAEILERD